MHIDTVVSRLKAQHHEIGLSATRQGVLWIRVDGVEITEEQARFLAIGRYKTIDDIDRINRKNRRGPLQRARSLNKRT